MYSITTSILSVHRNAHAQHRRNGGGGGGEDWRNMINNLRYVDDTVTISESEGGLKQLMDIMVSKSERKGLYHNHQR